MGKRLKTTLVLLAGGRGTRMRSLTNDEFPKSLITLGPETVLARNLRQAERFGSFSKIVLAVSNGNLDWNKQMEKEIASLAISTPVVMCQLQPKGTRQAVLDVLSRPDDIDGAATLVYGDTVLSDDAFSSLFDHVREEISVSYVAVTKSAQSRTDKYVSFEEGSIGRAESLRISSHPSADSTALQFGGIMHLSRQSVEKMVSVREASLPSSFTQMVEQVIFDKGTTGVFEISWAVNLNEPGDVEHAKSMIGGQY